LTGACSFVSTHQPASSRASLFVFMHSICYLACGLQALQLPAPPPRISIVSSRIAYTPHTRYVSTPHLLHKHVHKYTDWSGSCDFRKVSSNQHRTTIHVV